MHLLRSSHFGPTMVVTTVSFLLAHSFTSLGSAFLIALTIFSGQLCVGWTNDLVDLETDRSEARTNKPIAQGLISQESVTISTFVALTVAIGLSLLGPLGLRGGTLHLLGVGCGVAYNFYFKRTLLSPLPYLVAFAALPSAILISQHRHPPIWLITSGALFGLAAHFANVVKDIDVDQATGIKGLPQVVGARASLFITGISLLEIAITLALVTKNEFILPISVLASLGLFLIPRKFSFLLILVIALVDVGVLVTLGNGYFSQRF